MSFNNCFKRLNIEDINSGPKSSKKTLSLFELVFIGVGMIVGSGIFVLTGIASCLYAGPAVIISFLLSGFVSLCSAMCYAEFASMIKNGGNSYSYLQISLGELPAYIVGMLTIAGYFLGVISVILGWSRYFMSFLSDTMFQIDFVTSFLIKEELFFKSKLFLSLINLPALFIVLFFTLILYYGIKISSFFTLIFLLIKMLTLVCFIIVGIFYITPENWIPFVPRNHGAFGTFGISGIFMGASILFIAFNGIDAVCSASQETKNPQKNTSIGILITVLIVLVIYILTSIVLTGVVNYKSLCGSEPFYIVLKKINLIWFKYFIAIGSLVGLTASIFISFYTIVKMLSSIGNDGFLPACLIELHYKNKTPYRIIILIGMLISIIILIFAFYNIVVFSSIFILISLVAVCSSSIYMRYKFPNIKRGFKCPLMPFIPLVTIFLSCYIIFSNSLETLSVTFLFVVVLVIFYFFFKLFKN